MSSSQTPITRLVQKTKIKDANISPFISLEKNIYFGGDIVDGIVHV